MSPRALRRARLALALALVCVGCEDQVAGVAADVAVDAMPDAMPDITHDSPDGTHDSPDGIPDSSDGTPDSSDGMTGMPDAIPDGIADGMTDSQPADMASPDAIPGPAPVTALDDPLPAEPSPVGLPDDAVVLEVYGRPCRGDLYVVDAVHGGSAPVADFAPVVADMQARARRDFAAWFCVDGAPCAGADRVTAVGERLLSPERVGPESAGRFHRLWFELDGERLTARDGAQCDIVSALRTAVDSHGDLLAANIARACDAVAQSPARPTPEMLSWHLDRMGLDGPGAPVVPVHVALIDTAVDPAVAASIDLEVHPGSTATPAIHGTAMAALIRQAAPDARLHLFPALSVDHTGPVGDVARAIADALAVMPAGLPRVINLSLGWPPEARGLTDLAGDVLGGRPGQCLTIESPTGAPVRHMLARAADQEVPVFTAAGNRSDLRWLGDQLELDEDERDVCARDWRGEVRGQPPKLFYPAQWGLERSCEAGEDVGRRLAIPVGAHDSRDRAATLHVDFGFATLMAPGQHVMVDGPARPRRASICVDGDTTPPVDADLAVRLPATLSGTSVATALTSGLAARWLGHIPDRPDLDPDEVTPRQLEFLLYASGRPLCPGRRVFPEVQYRGLWWPGMAALAACDDLPALLGCLVAQDDDLPALISETIAACRARFVQCGVDPDPAAPDCAADPPAEPDWADAECLPLRPDDPDAPDLSRPCIGDCPFVALAPDRYSVGSLGPQPQDPWCPDCRFTARVAPGGGLAYGSLDIALNPDAPADTEIVSPLLWVETERGTDVYVNLADYVPHSYWKPGAGFTISGLKLSVPDDPVLWTKLDARLVLYVQQPDGKTIVRDVSPLRLIVR